MSSASTGLRNGTAGATHPKEQQMQGQNAPQERSTCRMAEATLPVSAKARTRHAPPASNPHEQAKTQREEPPRRHGAPRGGRSGEA
eukprot:3091682-Alexandrium_andersonii.AAC.1